MPPSNGRGWWVRRSPPDSSTSSCASKPSGPRRSSSAGSSTRSTASIAFGCRRRARDRSAGHCGSDRPAGRRHVPRARLQGQPARLHAADRALCDLRAPEAARLSRARLGAGRGRLHRLPRRQDRRAADDPPRRQRTGAGRRGARSRGHCRCHRPRRVSASTPQPVACARRARLRQCAARTTWMPTNPRLPFEGDPASAEATAGEPGTSVPGTPAPSTPAPGTSAPSTSAKLHPPTPPTAPMPSIRA